MVTCGSTPRKMKLPNQTRPVEAAEIICHFLVAVEG